MRLVCAPRVAVTSSPLATEGNRLLGDIYLVFAYMDYDLGGLLNKGIEFTLREIKCLSKQLLQGTAGGG